MEGRYQQFYEQPFQKYEPLDIDQIINSFPRPDVSFSTLEIRSFTKMTDVTCPTSDIKPSAACHLKWRNMDSCIQLQGQDRMEKEMNSKSVNVEITEEIRIQKRKQSLNMWKFFHQEVSNLAKQLVSCRILEQEQYQQVNRAMKEGKNSQSIKKAMKNRKICESWKRLGESSEVIKRVIRSDRMEMGRKLLIIKHMRKYSKQINNNRL